MHQKFDLNDPGTLFAFTRGLTSAMIDFEISKLKRRASNIRADGKLDDPRQAERLKRTEALIDERERERAKLWANA